MSRIRFREHRVPLDGIAEAAEAIVELYGGTIRERESSLVVFGVPAARNPAIEVECVLSWSDDPDGSPGEGILTLETGRELVPPKSQTVLLLIVGSMAGILSLMWPYFPDLGPILIVAAVIAIATFLLTLRMTPGGLPGDLLRRLARSQREEQKRDGNA